MTRWGAVRDSPARTAGALRALASRHGVALMQAEDVDGHDLAAAVVAVDLLVLATGVTSLTELANPARGVSAPLARALLRAAGQAAAGPRPDRDGPRVHVDAWGADAVDDLLAWATSAGLDAAAVAERAAMDLGGAADTRVAAYAACLACRA
jgi:hypothetical protein